MNHVLHESWGVCTLLVGTVYSLPLVHQALLPLFFLTRWFFPQNQVVSSQACTDQYWAEYTKGTLCESQQFFLCAVAGLYLYSLLLLLQSVDFLKAVSWAVTGPILFVSSVSGINVLHCVMSSIWKTFVSFFFFSSGFRWKGKSDPWSSVLARSRWLLFNFNLVLLYNHRKYLHGLKSNLLYIEYSERV